MFYLLLQLIINIFHLIVIIFVLTAPFVFGCSPLILILHIVFCFSLMVHWYSNNDICCLSEFEAYVTGKDRVDTFSHSLIAPMYNFPPQVWSQFCYILTGGLMVISIYKLVKCEKSKKAIDNLYKGTFFTEENIKLLI